MSACPRLIPWSISLFLVLTVLAPSRGLSQDSIPSLMERVGTLRSKRLAESSGVAVSRRHPGILWTHNDSGDKPVVYAINLAGDLLAAYDVPSAKAVDWEDIALAECPGRTGQCLYIADTGDNSEKRKSVSVYLVPEPDPTGKHPTDTLHTEPAREARFRYPDGSHDTEAIFVEPPGNMVLVTKGRSGAILRFSLPPADFDRDSSIAQLIDTLPIVPQRTLGRWVTGAASSPSGKRVVIRTYSELYFFIRKPDEKLQRDGEPCWLGAAEPQGEGVDFLDEDTVVLTSESLAGQEGTMFLVRCSHSPARPRR